MGQPVADRQPRPALAPRAHPPHADPHASVPAPRQAYAREVHASKGSLLLLNKADLLPPHVRTAWADYFDAVGGGVGGAASAR